jgi:hypothetical protein
MHSWIKCVVAAGVGGTVAMASSASFGRGVRVETGSCGCAASTYEPYACSYYPGSGPQYHGGPKSDVTRDAYPTTDQYLVGDDGFYSHRY